MERLVEEALRCSADYLALTDINCTTGVFDFVKSCREAGIKPIVGVEFRKDDQLLYVGLAKNIHGFRELNELLTKTNLGEMPFPLQSPAFHNVFVIYPCDNIPKIIQPHEFVGIRPAELKRYKNPLLKNLNKLVSLQPVTYRSNDEFELHQLLDI